ncbi:MAG: hypothetical protein HeimC3_28100 [Candidatus Heimdallarchaeota archaeon LC_3]|nr:MAG: hypothetical protein HeimC3_28100 [Candidatus Heimdallarchaeota archaeon LC_3]
MASINFSHFTKSLFKVLFILSAFLILLYYLYLLDLLIQAIAIFSILYLIIYGSIGTLMVFSAISEVMGSNDLNINNNFLFSIIFYIVIVFVLWLVILAFWPLFAIPDSALSKKKKYNSIENFEEKLRQKYGPTVILDTFVDTN